MRNRPCPSLYAQMRRCARGRQASMDSRVAPHSSASGRLAEQSNQKQACERRVRVVRVVIRLRLSYSSSVCALRRSFVLHDAVLTAGAAVHSAATALAATPQRATQPAAERACTQARATLHHSNGDHKSHAPPGPRRHDLRFATDLRTTPRRAVAPRSRCSEASRCRRSTPYLRRTPRPSQAGAGLAQGGTGSEWLC